MLTEIKNDTCHYFLDEKGLKQGEFKEWHNNGILRKHCFYVNDNFHGNYIDWYRNGQVWEHMCFVNGIRHGEYKRWGDNGNLVLHCFYNHGGAIGFSEIPYPKTNEDRVYFKLKYGLPLLSETNVC